MAATVPGAGGLIFLPFLNGERTPDLPSARGTLTGISPNNFTPANLIRAAVEGVSFGILNGLDLIQGGTPVERILVIGGGSRSAAWRQLLADASGATVEVPLEDEAGCLGAAIQAMYIDALTSAAPTTFAALASRCVGVDPARSAKPDAALREPYRVARQRYAAVLAATYP
jgi:xylulokinase